ncbi:hypothetical protein [Actinoplanes sp. NBRC 103695]|uniref:hypothetical protein n=1 Tax=Actinoplanes sp. NBRC 103695 TaxID=3032202 RepID=UPI002555FFE9|nr:hypothetical protein [Actinoplanes sp. NBRC 103695]
MSRNQTAVSRSQATGETYRVARQRIADAHVSVVAFLNDDNYGNTDTLPFIRPIAAALAQAGRRVLLVTDSGVKAQVVFRPLWEQLVPGQVQQITRNVDLLMIPADLDFDEFHTLELLRRHRDGGAYTHLLIDSGNEDNLTPAYQVGGAFSDVALVCLKYNRLPAHPQEQQVEEWVTARAPQLPAPPAGRTDLARWVHDQVGLLRRRLAPAAVHGRAMFGPQVWDAAYERALGWHAFAAWIAVHNNDESSYPLWVNLGRPLLDEPGSIAYLHEVADSVQKVLGDRDYLGLPERAHRTAVLGYDIDGGSQYWTPIARRLSTASPVTLLHTAIPYFSDEGTPFHRTVTGRQTYRQVAMNLDQITGHRRTSRR